MSGLTRPLLAFALLLPACGPDKGTTDSSSATTTAGPTSADTTADTTADPSGTTADTPTTGEPETSNGATTSPGTVPCPGDSLPPEGAGCNTFEEVCNPFDDDCAAHTLAMCDENLIWQYIDIGPGDPNECNPDACEPFPEEDQPCTAEGAFCGSGCEDQCQFCNILMCSGGVWTRLEAPPAPCASCEELCPPTLAAMCSAGPPDEAACLTGCMNAMEGPCNIEFSNVRACAAFAPTFTCDDMSRPFVEGCETQFAEFYECSDL